MPMFQVTGGRPIPSPVGTMTCSKRRLNRRSFVVWTLEKFRMAATLPLVDLSAVAWNM
jgi:hypothetical protein